MHKRIFVLIMIAISATSCADSNHAWGELEPLHIATSELNMHLLPRSAVQNVTELREQYPYDGTQFSVISTSEFDN